MATSIGCSEVKLGQTFDQMIKSTRRTKMPLSSVQLFAVYLVSFDFIFIAQFNVETMKSS